MEILVPVDGSDCSSRALRFACEMADRYDGSLHVVHITDMKTDATEEIVRRATAVCDEEGVADEPEVLTDSSMQFQPSRHVGKGVVRLVQERGYDHVVMGHHGSDAVGRFIIGSAAETVIEANEVPVTIVP